MNFILVILGIIALFLITLLVIAQIVFMKQKDPFMITAERYLNGINRDFARIEFEREINRQILTQRMMNYYMNT